jgi:hypothetical protein
VIMMEKKEMINEDKTFGMLAKVDDRVMKYLQSRNRDILSRRQKLHFRKRRR